MAAEGCNVDINSKLKIGSEQTHPKCKLSLEERPYLTVPYLGRGLGDPELELQLKQGENFINKKIVTNFGIDFIINNKFDINNYE